MALRDGGSEFRLRPQSCALTKTDDVKRASQSSGGASTKKVQIPAAAAVGLVPSVSTPAIAQGDFEHDAVS
jgi:hypothetical protein